MVTFNESEEINHYIDRYFKVLKFYYNEIKLKVNSEKTNILLVLRRNRRQETDDIFLVDGNETLVPKNQIRTLGWILNTRRCMDANANNAIRGVN